MQISKALLVIASYVSLSVCSMEVTVFDVGQGNCVLFGYTGRADPEPPLLNDCGSSSYKYRSDEHMEEQLAAIVEKIRKYTSATRQKLFNIVISHPDVDHYGWIHKVIAGCKKKNISVGKIRLGGLEKYYNKKLRECLAKLNADKTVVDIQYPTKDDSTKKEEVISTSKKVSYKILPALKVTKKDDANDGSLVLLVTFGKIACLVMADATKKTTAHIREYFKSYSAYLCIPSHHGAEDEGCNEEAWLNEVGPSMIVVSSGIHTYQHPRASIIRRFERSLEESLPEYHPVISGIGKDDLFSELPYYALMGKGGNFKGGKGYGFSATCRALYGTLGQGTMVFTWKENASKMSPPKCSIVQNYENKKECIINSLMSSPVEALSIDRFKMINLSELKIDDTQEDDKALLHQLLNCMLELGLTIRKVYLSGNNIQTNESFELIKKLLRNDRIREFQLEDAGISDSMKKEIHAIWANRGLLL